MEAYFINSETGEVINLPKMKKYVLDESGNGRTINDSVNYLENLNTVNFIEISYVNNIYIIINCGTQTVNINDISLIKGIKAALADGDKITIGRLDLIFRIDNDVDEEIIDKSKIEQASDGNIKINVVCDSANNKSTMINNHKQIVSEFEHGDIYNFKIETIKSNAIRAFLKMDILRIGTELKILYDVDDKVSLDEYIKSKDFKDYESPIIIFNIITNLESIREYLLDYRDLNLKIQNIFVSKENLEIKHVISVNTEEAEDIFTSLINIIITINEIKPNNYLCHEKSDILSMLNNTDSSLEEVSRAIIKQEMQNKIEDSFTNNRIEIKNKELEPYFNIDRDIKSIGFLKEKSATNQKKFRIFEKIYGLKLILVWQVILILILGIIYLTNFLNIFDFIALLIILSALDVWILKINKFI
jgi:hypothetical protein